MGELNDEESSRRFFAFEAYDVLSDSYWRELYDQYGEKGIKSGVLADNENNIKRYAYHGDIFLTYKSVFGSTNPYSHIMSMLAIKKAVPNPGDHLATMTPVKKIPLRLTLDEIFFGTLKKISFTTDDGLQKLIDVKVPCGIPAGFEIVKHDENGNMMIFIIEDLPHELYVRDGMNLISTFDISMHDMLCGAEFTIKTLDHKRLHIKITQPITPTYEKTIHGQGMLSYGDENSSKRGDIVLKFRVQMPSYLPIEELKELEWPN